MKKIFLLFLLCTINICIYGAYLQNVPITLTQPDGTVVNCFATGDEFYNWVHDANGYTIIQASNGYYYYAEKDGDLLKASIYLVNSIDPASVGLTKWLKISIQSYQQKVKSRFKAQNALHPKPAYAPRQGILNNLVIYIRFADDSEFSTTRQVYENNFNAPTGVALKSYFKEVSYNNLTINSSHYPDCALNTNASYQDSHPRNYFLPYNATTNINGYTSDGEKSIREHTLLANAINWMKTNSPFDTSLNIDADGDGNVDNICFIIKGSSGGWNDLLWAHRWSLYTQNVTINGKKVDGYTLQPEDQVAVQTLCHEMSHSLGMPDLYHYSNQGNFSPVSSWDLMDSGGGHMTTYMKWKYTNQTWINSIPQISNSGTYTLNPVTSATNNCFKIASPYSNSEYFMVEYRLKTGTFEQNIPGSGLIVYRIDTRQNGNAGGPPDEIYIYRPGGTKSSDGNINSANFSSNVFRTAISDATSPSSFLQNGSAGGLSISNVSAADNTITFDVTIPISCTTPTQQASVFVAGSNNVNSTDITWTRGNGDAVIVLARKAGAVNADPLSGANYTADASFGNGSEIGNGNYVVYKGDANTAAVLGLLQGTTYHFAIYEYNNASNCYSVAPLRGSITTIGLAPSKTTDYLADKAQSVLTTYVDLGSNGSIISTDNFDDANSQPQEIGFPFVYNDQTFNQFVLNTNGFIKLGNVAPSASALFFNGPQNIEGGILSSTKPVDVNLISPFNADLMAGTAIPEYRVYTSGSEPNRVCTIQFKNVRDKTTSPAQQYDNMQFQIKLYETSKVIEFVYGDWSPSLNTSDTKTAVCGLKGVSSDANQLIVVTKSPTATWGSISFANSNYSANENAFNFGNPTARPKPDVGRTYRFNPLPDKVLNIGEIYALSEASRINSNPQIVSVNVTNTGRLAQTDIPVTLTVSGANSFTETKYIPSLNPGTSTRVAFNGFSASTLGATNISVTLPNDVYNPDNTKTISQNTTENICNYSPKSRAATGWGGSSGGAYYVKYRINGTAKVNTINAFIYNNTANVGKTVFGIVLNSLGAIIGKSSYYVIQQSDLGKWYSFYISTAPVVTDGDFYAGFGANSSSTAYYALGVQNENPIRPNTYFQSNVDGSSLVQANPTEFFYRYMIGASLETIVSGIEHIDSNLVNIYPNPVSNELHIEIANLGIASFEIVNMMGQIVRVGQLNEKTIIQTSDLIDGIYFVKVKVQNSIITRKIVKE